MSCKQKRAGHRTHTENVITKAEALISKPSVSEAEAYELTGHLKVIQTKLEILHQFDSAVLDEIDETKDTTGQLVVKEQADVEKYTTDFETRFAILEAKFENKVHPILHPASNPGQGSSGTGTTAQSTVNNAQYKLPKISPKTFSGKQMDWIAFLEDFEAAVDSTSLASVTKLRYLKSCLSGPPLSAVDNLPVVGDSYTDAIKILKLRYGDKEVNIETHISALCDMAGPEDKSSTLLQFYDAVQNHLRALRYLGKTDIQLNELCTPLIRRRLPRGTRVQLKRIRGSQTWTLTEFLDQLFNEISAMCDGDFSSDKTTLPDDNLMSDPKKTSITAAFSTISTGQKQTFRSQSASPMRGRRPTPPRSSCPYCKSQNHRANECQKVPKADDRVDILIRDSLCINCTGPHNRSECQSTRTCVECRGTHHSSIHEAFTVLPKSNESAGQGQGSQQLRRLSTTSPQRTSSPNGIRTQVTLAQAAEDR